GFSGETKILTIRLSRILFPNFFLILLAGILTSVFTSYKEFGLTSVVRIVHPVLVIMLLFLSKSILGVLSLGLGNILGSLLTIIILIYALYLKGYRYIFTVNFNHAEFKNLLFLIVPFIFQSIIAQGSTIITNIIVSFLSEGSLSYLNYADKIVRVFSGILFSGLPLVIFPVFAEKITNNNIMELKTLALKAIRVLQTLTIPLCVYIVFLGRSVIHLFFERGEFNGTDTQMTYQVLSLHVFTLIFTGYNLILTKILYAMRKTKQIAVMSIISIIMFLIVSLILVKLIGIQGFVIAGLVSLLTMTVGATMIIQQRYPGFCNGFYGIYIIKIILLTLLSLILVYSLSRLIFICYGRLNINWEMVNIVLTIGLGSAIFSFLGLVFKTEEILIFYRKIK
ncbi:MAG: lipid II flippase MurJ, partial [Elusimicrobiota bacterium]